MCFVDALISGKKCTNCSPVYFAGSRHIHSISIRFGQFWSIFDIFMHFYIFLYLERILRSSCLPHLQYHLLYLITSSSFTILAVFSLFSAVSRRHCFVFSCCPAPS